MNDRPTRLIFVRHGETEWNVLRRLQGHSDTPLNELGRAQAAAAAQRLAGYADVDVILTSDLKRAAESAAIIAEATGAEVRHEPRLRELSFGVFEGLTWDEIGERHAEMRAAWLADRDQPPEGGESMADFTARLDALLGHVLSAYEGKTVVLATHGGTIRELLFIAMGLPSLQERLGYVGNASLSEVAYYDGRAVLVSFNDTGHLPPG